MRILHTSDWHLGKTLEGYSRIEEQEKFVEELIETVEKEDIELILVAGDIYDTSNPPAAAEKLFYKSMKRLSKEGQRPIIVIAGNHDNPERLTAASPLAWEQGIILLGTPRSIAEVGDYGSFQVVESGQGYIKLRIHDQEAVVIALPYPSEKRLNEIISESGVEEEMQISYSQRIGEIFKDLSHHFKEDTINLAMSHLYITGGEESDSERQIQLGGSFAVNASLLPPAQYIALGHLHRPQIVPGSQKKAYYSGSPLQYSKSEINYSKCVYKIDVHPGEDAKVEPIYIKNHKPIEVWKCNGIEEALKRCEEERDKEAWVYLEIETERVLTGDEIKNLRDIRRDIVEIRPILSAEERQERELEDLGTLNMLELFENFYVNERGVAPSEEILELFSKIIDPEGDIDETIEIED